MYEMCSGAPVHSFPVVPFRVSGWWLGCDFSSIAVAVAERETLQFRKHVPYIYRDRILGSVHLLYVTEHRLNRRFILRPGRVPLAKDPQHHNKHRNSDDPVGSRYLTSASELRDLSF